MKQLLSIVTITTNDIVVNVKIDFNRKQVSLVDNCFDHKDKNWVFACRGLQHQKGWHDILNAMQVAIDYGFEQLQKEKDEHEKELTKKVSKLLKKNPNFGKMRENKGN